MYLNAKGMESSKYHVYIISNLATNVTLKCKKNCLIIHLQIV